MTAVPARAPDRESLFLRIADWVPAPMGRPANIIVWMIAAAAWTPPFALGGPHGERDMAGRVVHQSGCRAWVPCAWSRFRALR